MVIPNQFYKADRNIYLIIVLKILFLIWLVSVLFSASLYSQTFTEVATQIPSLSSGSVAWGDYDNDGFLDILLAGKSIGGRITRIYQNINGTFHDINAGLDEKYFEQVAWGDYDNDDDLDVLMTGSNTNLFRNDNGKFVDLGINLAAVARSACAWGDYDNDNDLDILVTGWTGSSNLTKIYRNEQDTLIDINVLLIGVTNGSIDWGDYDNDGDLDILLTGYYEKLVGFNEPISKIYRNDNESFIDINAQIIELEDPSTAWGDYDNDGDLDIIISGDGHTKIYQNNDGKFLDSNCKLPGVSDGSLAWGDYDDDGDLDILLTGRTGYYWNSPYIANIYRNDQGNFVVSDTSLTGVNSSSVAWGDYDNDGDLDILLTGESKNGRITKLYQNNLYQTNQISPNIPPSAPNNLTVDIQKNNVTLNWDKPQDSHKNQQEFSYNIYPYNVTYYSLRFSRSFLFLCERYER